MQINQLCAKAGLWLSTCYIVRNWNMNTKFHVIILKWKSINEPKRVRTLLRNKLKVQIKYIPRTMTRLKVCLHGDRYWDRGWWNGSKYPMASLTGSHCSANIFLQFHGSLLNRSRYLSQFRSCSRAVWIHHKSIQQTSRYWCSSNPILKKSKSNMTFLLAR